MEEIEIKLDTISFNGDTPEEEYAMKDKDTEKPCLSMLARSTPASPNSFRCNNAAHNIVGSSKDLTNKTRNELQFLTVSILPKLEKCISEPEMCNKDCKDCNTQRSVETDQNDGSCPGSKSDGHISRMIFKLSGRVEGESNKNSSEDTESGDRMLSESHMTPQPPVIALRHGTPAPCQTEALIMPRKLPNPCMESQDRQNLHRELLFNQKIGKNVLNQKSELQRAMEKHKDTQIRKELEMQKQENRSPLEKVIEERARRLENTDKNNCVSEENQPEFLQVHAKLRARMNTK